MAKRLNKNDIIRGRIFDQLAEMYGASVLGFYEGKLRVEIIDEDTDEVIQFSLAPVVHKVLIEDSECDAYVDTNTRIEEFQASLKKNEVKGKKEVKTKDNKKPSKEPSEKEVVKIMDESPVPITDDVESAELDALLASLDVD